MTEKELQDSLEIFAHKLKNPLHAAGLNLDVLKIKLGKQKSDKATLKHLQIVEDEFIGLSDLVMKYLKFLKMSDKKQSEIDLKKYLS